MALDVHARRQCSREITINIRKVKITALYFLSIGVDDAYLGLLGAVYGSHVGEVNIATN